MGRKKRNFGKPNDATVLQFITIYRETLNKTFKNKKGLFYITAKCHPEGGLKLVSKDNKLDLSCLTCDKYMLAIAMQSPVELIACSGHKGYRVAYTKDGLTLSCVTCKKKLNLNLEVSK